MFNVETQEISNRKSTGNWIKVASENTRVKAENIVFQLVRQGLPLDMIRIQEAR